MTTDLYLHVTQVYSLVDIPYTGLSLRVKSSLGGIWPAKDRIYQWHNRSIPSHAWCTSLLTGG